MGTMTSCMQRITTLLRKYAAAVDHVALLMFGGAITKAVSGGGGITPSPALCPRQEPLILLALPSRPPVSIQISLFPSYFMRSISCL